MQGSGLKLYPKKTGFGIGFYIGIITIVIILCSAFFLWSRNMKHTSNETVNELGKFYLAEIAEQNVNNVIAELNRRTVQMEYALTELNHSYLKDQASIREYISMVQNINGLDMFALVDEEGMVYTADSTFSGIARFGFLTEEIEETGYYSVKSYGAKAMMIIAVPTDKICDGGLHIKACFSGLNVESVISSSQLESDEHQTHCRLFTKDGENLLSISGDYEAGRNLFDILAESAVFAERYSLEEMQDDWLNNKSGYTVYATKNAGNTYVYYYAVPGTDWVITSLMRESNINKVINTSTKKMVRGSLIQVVIVALSLVSLLLMILQVSHKMHVTQENLNVLEVISALSSDYLNVFLVDLKSETTQIIKLEGYITQGFDKNATKLYPYFEMCQQYVKERVYKDDVQMMLDAMKMETLRKEISDNDEYARTYRILENEKIHYYQFKYIKIEGTEKVIAGFQNIDAVVAAEKERIENERKMTEQLIISNTDELTRLLNRRAYEEELKNYTKSINEENFVYVSIDVNGLKVINDSLGHIAGDELIIGAANCLKSCLGPYGRIFRIGGDEFAAIIFATKEQLSCIKSDLENTVNEWQGEMAKELSISTGYVTKREFPNQKVIELAKIADERMYKDKEEYYCHKGIDRRGRQEAYSELCRSYLKILKVDLGCDRYQIIQMDENDKIKEKGFSEKLSEWLRDFGALEQVHKDDLKEYIEKTDLAYIKQYLIEHKKPLNIFYRRYSEEGYRLTKMELIPTKDYDAMHQTIYLYVKDIGK